MQKLPAGIQAARFVAYGIVGIVFVYTGWYGMLAVGVGVAALNLHYYVKHGRLMDYDRH